MRNERRGIAVLLVFAPLALGGGSGACNAEVREAPLDDGGLEDAGADGGPTDAATDAPPDLRSCTTQNACALVAATCCGVCGEPAATDMTSVHWDRVDAHRLAVCGPGPVPCPACAVRPNPHLATACRGGQCAAIDVRTDEASDCTADADCTLRYGTACCEVCSGTAEQLTALATSQLAKTVRCLPNEGACPPCAPVYPEGARARCNPATKHCEVALR
jgi:hypothetical protein